MTIIIKCLKNLEILYKVIIMFFLQSFYMLSRDYGKLNNNFLILKCYVIYIYLYISISSIYLPKPVLKAWKIKTKSQTIKIMVYWLTCKCVRLILKYMTFCQMSSRTLAWHAPCRYLWWCSPHLYILCMYLEQINIEANV